MGEQRLDLRSEQETVARRRVEEGTHAQPVAREKQLLLLDVPDGKSPLAVEPIDAILSFLLIQMQDDFGVARGLENGAFTLQRVLRSIQCS